ncbi:hypothetical protein CR513_11458, partial [Mucuna pruriens]
MAICLAIKPSNSANQVIELPHPVPDVAISFYSLPNSDLGGWCITCKSTTGFCVYLGGLLIPCLPGQGITMVAPTVPTVMVLCDNMSAIQMATNPTSNERSKHIHIDCNFIRHHVFTSFQIGPLAYTTAISRHLHQGIGSFLFLWPVVQVGCSQHFFPNLR